MLVRYPSPTPRAGDQGLRGPRSRIVGAASTALGATVTPGVVTAVAAVPAPTVIAGTGATPTPGVVTAVAAVPAPSILRDATATPAVVVATAAVPAPTTKGDALALAQGLIAVPSLISGLVGWYDFSDASTLFTDTARTTAVSADGQAVAGVTDKSGAGNHLAQATLGNRPLYKQLIKDGRDSALFDGADDYLDKSGMVLTPPRTVLALAWADPSPGSPNWKTVWDAISVSPNSLGLFHNATSAKWDAKVSVDLLSVVVYTSEWATYAVIYNGASSAFYYKGTLDSSGDTGSGTPTGLRIGSSSSGSAITSWKGYIGEAVVFSGVLSATDLTKAHSYLLSRWRLATVANPVAAVGAVPAPTISLATNATPTPAVVAGIAAVPAPVVNASATATPGVVVAVAAVPAPTIVTVTSATATPAVVVAVAGVAAPSVIGNANAPPSAAVAAVAAVPAPTVLRSATATPAVVVAVAAVPAPTITRSAAATPAVVTAVAAVPAPAAGAGTTVTPGVVTAVTAVLAPVVGVHVTPTPGVVVAVAAVPAPNILRSTLVTVGVVTAVAAVPAPAVNLSATVAFLDSPYLTATAISGAQVDLVWTAVAGAGRYDIYRDGSLIVNGHLSTTYSDITVTQLTTYAYRVRARP